MKNKIRTILSSLFLAVLVSCGPATLPQTETLTSNSDHNLFLTAEMGSTLAAMLTQTAAQCNGCPGSNFSLSLTAQMATNFASTPSNTPPAGATVIPIAGDLGWGSVYGVILNGVTNTPLAGVTIHCDHFSYTSAYRCNGVATSDQNGNYVFRDVYFHDTDRVTLTAELPGYAKTEITQSVFIQPDVHIDMGLFPGAGASLPPSPTAYMMCTPPACSGGKLVCGSADGCPGGCGTICQMPTP